MSIDVKCRRPTAASGRTRPGRNADVNRCALTPKTRARVRINFGNDLFNGSRFRQWFVTVPLQILALPIQLPYTARSYKGRFSDWNFMHLAITLPHWPNLEYFNALASEPKIKINFFS
jgi:hypothetical protein